MLSLLLYLPLFVISLALLVRRFLSDRAALGYIFLCLSYCLVYGAGGAYSDVDFEGSKGLYAAFGRPDPFVKMFAAFLALLAFFVSLLGYRFGIKILKKVGVPKVLGLDNIRKASFVAAMLCGIFVLIYISQYGGLSNALINAAAIRSGFGEVEEGSTLTFVKYLMPIGIFPLLAFVYTYVQTRKKTYLLYSLVIASILLLAFILMSGRTRIVIALLSVAMIAFYAKDGARINIRMIFVKGLPLLVAAMFVVVFGKTFFSSFSRSQSLEINVSELGAENSNNSFIDGFFGYYAHRTYSSEVAIDKTIGVQGVNLFSDIALFPLFFIPERLTGIVKPDSISFKNTENLTGIYDSMIPPGLVAYGLYALWIPGVFIIAWLYGMVYGVLDSAIRRWGGGFLIIATPVLFIWVSYGFAADSRVFANASVYVYVFLILLFCTDAVRRFRLGVR